MKWILRLLVIGVSVVLLLSCNPGPGLEGSYTQSDPGEVATHPAETTQPVTTEIENLALGSISSASASLPDGPPGNAVDGDPDSSWNAGSAPEQWIQIDLGGVASVSKIRLVIAQYPFGNTNHVVLVGSSVSELQEVHVFEGITTDNQALEALLDPPISNVRYVRVLTVESPSWVAWREIEVYAQGSPITSTQVADVIYYNGQILTMESNLPTAEAIAMLGDKILAVGSEAEVMAYKGGTTTLVDMGGLTATPGFIDSHAHRIGDRWHFGDVSAEQMMTKALSQGWTSIHELFVYDQRLAELENLARTDTLPLRISMYLTMNFDYEYTKWWQAYQPLHQYNPYLQIAGLKITLDREWGEQIFFTQEQYTQMVLDATRAGWQVATHSFSPNANQIVLNGYEAGLDGKDNDTLRLRLEHIGTMTDTQLHKMAELEIIGSVQFLNASALVDDSSFKNFIPASEVQHTARWRDLINAGIFLIGNTDDPWCCTDWRNEFINPPNDASVIQSIYQGVTRKTFTDREIEPWQVAQAVTAQEALEMLTINGAYAAHQEDVIGSLRPDKYADMVILSANPVEVPVDQIPDIYVVMTMVGGAIRYCAPEYQNICEPTP